MKMLFKTLLSLILVFTTNIAVINASAPVLNGIPIDEVASGGFVSLYNITNPGYYYLRDTIDASSFSGSAVVINCDNVTIDLNGFAIIGDIQKSFIGIRVVGTQNNITVKNGTIRGFEFMGIGAWDVESSTFQNLKLMDNGKDGIFVGTNCLIGNCTAINNGGNGIHLDFGNTVRDCVSADNGEDGIDGNRFNNIYNCVSYGNGIHGIDNFLATRVEGCTVYENSVHGIELTRAGICINNTVTDNGWHGIEVNEYCYVVQNVCNGNGVCISNSNCSNNAPSTNLEAGAGIFAITNVTIRDNECAGNYFGIAITEDDNTLMLNQLQKNKHSGIIAVATGNIVIGNSAEGNGFEQSPSISDTSESNGFPMGDFAFQTTAFENGSVGPIIDVSSSGDISTLSGADHPFANFIY